MKMKASAVLLLCCILVAGTAGEGASDFLNMTSTEGKDDIFIIPQPVLQQLCPRGLRIWISDSNDIRFVAFHVSVNKPLHGASPSEYNVDLGRPTEGHWQYDIPDLYLQKGDKVYYWLHIVHGDKSYLSTDHSWMIPGAPCSGVNSTSSNCQPSATVASSGFICSGQLLFEEEFNTLNFEVWKHEVSASGGRHNEFQMYTNSRSNSFVQDGVLHIRPTLTEDQYGRDFVYNGVLDLRGSSGCTNDYNNGCYKRAIGAHILNPVMSAHVQTAEAFTFQYGIIKIRAKMPRGDWLLAGMYLVPRHNAYGASLQSGRVVMAESRGNEGLLLDGTPYGSQRVEVGVQYGTLRKNNSVIKAFTTSGDQSNWATAFHDYEVEWTPDHIQFKVDDREVIKIVPPGGSGFLHDGDMFHSDSKLTPFDKPFFIALSLAVGGTSEVFPDNADNKPHPKPWNNTSPSPALDFWEKKAEWYSTWHKGDSDFQIDSIRVWALP